MTFLADGQEMLGDEVRRVLDIFREAEAKFVDVPTLLPAQTMLDVYGEDIRNRAYIVSDGVEGDFVLRPDFTVPIVEAHLEADARSARYAYSGRVWRKRRAADIERKHSFWQVGLELFDQNARAENDAEIFSIAMKIAQAHELRVRTGDLGLVFSILDQIQIADWRRDALKRQFWRPRAFERLLARYSSADKKYENLDAIGDAPVIGLRSRSMIESRIDRLRADALEPPISTSDIDALKRVLAIQGSLKDAREQLMEWAAQTPMIKDASEQFAARVAALESMGVDTSIIDFDASFGRETMEYYDGFVFEFLSHGTPVISGGRYDHLAQSFGSDVALSAVGMAYRPELFLGDTI